MTSPLPAATITTALLPVALVQPSPTNPRKRFAAAPLQELAESIAQHQLLQPIVVRPLPHAPAGQPQYEVVAGERRWRACTQLTEQGRNPHGACVPALVCTFTDAEVLVAQLTENLQREDLHPLEEGQHYQAMRDASIGLEDIAHAARVSEQRVRQRLQLLQLQPDAQQAFIEGRLTLGLAHQVARLPAHQQREAVQHLADWGGEPMGTKAAAAFIRDRLMLRLAEAPFDIADATLHPAAGACTACPHRTGANPQLWEDITDADRCANPPCFTAKKTAQRERLLDQLATTGYTVHQGDAARALCTADGRSLKPGLVLATDTVPYDLGDTALQVSDVLDRVAAPNHITQVVDHPSGTPLLYAVHTADLEQALRRINAHRSQLQPARAAPKAPKTPKPSTAAAQPPLADQDATPAAPATDFWADHPWSKLAAQQSAAPAALDLQAEPLASMLPFHVPATSAGLYAGQTADAFCARHARRVQALLAAARVAQHLQTDGAEGLPQHGLAPVLLDLMSYTEAHAGHTGAAQLLGLPGAASLRPDDVWAWATSLPEEDATKAALVMLTLQEADDTRYISAIEAALGLDFSDLAQTADDYVSQQLLLRGVQTGAAKKPQGHQA